MPDRAPSDMRLHTSRDRLLPASQEPPPPRKFHLIRSPEDTSPILISTTWNMVNWGVGNFLPYSASGMYPL